MTDEFHKAMMAKLRHLPATLDIGSQEAVKYAVQLIANLEYYLGTYFEEDELQATREGAWNAMSSELESLEFAAEPAEVELTVVFFVTDGPAYCPECYHTAGYASVDGPPPKATPVYSDGSGDDGDGLICDCGVRWSLTHGYRRG